MPLHVDKGHERNGGGGVQFTNVSWVDLGTGFDGTAVRGSETLKYQTIGAALAGAMPGDTIYVAQGLYVEDVDLPDMDLKIVGMEVPTIRNATARSTVRLTRASRVGQITVLENLFIDNTASGFACLEADAPIVFDNFDILLCTDVNFTRSDGESPGFSVSLTSLGVAVFNEISQDGPSKLVNVAVTTSSQTAWQDLDVTGDPTLGLLKPFFGGVGANFEMNAGSTCSTLTTHGAPMVVVQAGSSINALDSTDAHSYSILNLDPVDAAPSWRLAGRVNGGAPISVNIAFPDLVYVPATHPLAILDGSGGVINGMVQVAGTAGANRWANSEFNQAALSFDVTVGSSVDLQMRGARILGSLVRLLGTDGTVDRDIIRIVSRVVPAVGGFDKPLIDPPFPAFVSANDYGVLVERFDAAVGPLPTAFAQFCTFDKTAVDFKVTQDTVTPVGVQYTLVRNQP